MQIKAEDAKLLSVVEAVLCVVYFGVAPRAN